MIGLFLRQCQNLCWLSLPFILESFEVLIEYLCFLFQWCQTRSRQRWIWKLQVKSSRWVRFESTSSRKLGLADGRTWWGGLNWRWQWLRWWLGWLRLGWGTFGTGWLFAALSTTSTAPTPLYASAWCGLADCVDCCCREKKSQHYWKTKVCDIITNVYNAMYNTCKHDFGGHSWMTYAKVIGGHYSLGESCGHW